MLKINLAKLYFTSSMSGFTTKQFCYISLEGGVGGGGGEGQGEGQGLKDKLGPADEMR